MTAPKVAPKDASMIPRLHHVGKLSPGDRVSLSAAQAHYLRNVLRRETGAELKLFNAGDGEFAATIAEIGKKGALADIAAKLRGAETSSDIALLIAPLKRAAMDNVIQKATELGASAFLPVLTDRTNAERVRVDRLQTIALEAAEQCGRLSVPAIAAPARLAETLLRWDASRILYYCDEAGDDPALEWGGRDGRAAPLLEVAAAGCGQSAAILIGPEGGFTPDERKWLRALPFVRPATLGPRILRADTAAIVALALWQAAAGDLSRR